MPKVIIIIPFVLLLCQSCKTVPPELDEAQRYELLLDTAYKALLGGSITRAESLISVADLIVASGAVPPSPRSRLLLAEVRFAENDFSSAYELTQEVLSMDQCGFRTEAQAFEILAKTAVRQGHFSEAQEYLVKAGRAHEMQGDGEGVSGDLLKLVRGLMAYSEGDVSVACEYWKDITDAALRRSIDEAVRDASTEPVEMH